MLLTLALLACTTSDEALTDDTLALSEEIVDFETLDALAPAELAPEPLAVSETDIVEASPLETPVFLTTVRSGENLVLIAQWADVSVEEVLAVNPGLDPADGLRVGQELALPGEDGDDYVAMRQVWSDARLTRYLDKRGGLAGVVEHRVRTGDTAWDLASQEADVPMWVLASFNEGSDLEHLRIGDTVTLPVLADQIVAVNPVEVDVTAGQ